MFICIPLVWIFLNIYYLLTRNSKLKEIDFEAFSLKYTKMRCFLIVVKGLSVFGYTLLSILSIESKKPLTGQDKQEMYYEGISCCVIILFLAF